MPRIEAPKWSQQALVWLVFAGLIYFPLFLHLDVNPVKAWDEALFALRAYSLSYYGEYLCEFADLPGAEPAPNTKPPLISLFQAALFRLIGYNSLAMRLPIALSGVVIVLAMVWLSKLQTGEYVWGRWSGLVLVTTAGFIHEHVARTGDHDVPIAMFNLLTMLGAYLYTEEAPDRSRGVWLMALAWLGGWLTKGSLALLFVPAIGLYILFRKKLIPLLKDRQAWMALGVVVLGLALYAFYQEYSCPGYLDRSNRYEGMGRLTKSLGGHRHPWFFYLQTWWEWKLTDWLVWLIPAFLLPFIPSLKSYRNLLLLIWGCAISGTAVISYSGTKLLWYDASILPLIALLVGFSLMALHKGLQSLLKAEAFWQQTLIVAALWLTLFALPYQKIMDKVYQPQDRMYVDERHPFLLERLEKYYPNEREFAILQTYRSNHVLFYRYVYNHHKGFTISRYRELEEIKLGDKVMICQPDADDYFRRYFQYFPIAEYENCTYYRVDGYTEAGLENLDLEVRFLQEFGLPADSVLQDSLLRHQLLNPIRD